MRRIVTARLVLEPVTPENAEALWRLMQEPDLRRYQDLPACDLPSFLDVVRRRPRRLSARSSGRFEFLIVPAVLSPARPVGWVSLRIGDGPQRVGEIGYSVVREWRGQGVATEAVAAVVREASARGSVARLTAYCMPDNAPSRRVLEKTGFRLRERIGNGAVVGGVPVDVVCYEHEPPESPERSRPSRGRRPTCGTER